MPRWYSPLLSVGGETVFPETFRALLNGVDVTARFHPGTAGGADLAALFELGALPLQEGRNVIRRMPAYLAACTTSAPIPSRRRGSRVRTTQAERSLRRRGPPTLSLVASQVHVSLSSFRTGVAQAGGDTPGIPSNCDKCVAILSSETCVFMTTIPPTLRGDRMKWLNLTVCLFAVATMWDCVPAVAQERETTATALRWGSSERALDARLIPPQRVFANHDGEDPNSSVLLIGVTAEREGRPWWLIPAITTAGGALLYELARGDECENTDCIIYIPPPVTGAVLGLVVGTVVEVSLRLSSR